MAKVPSNSSIHWSPSSLSLLLGALLTLWGKRSPSCPSCHSWKGKGILGSSNTDPSSTHSPDPYVKVWLMYKDKRVEKKKTVTMKRNLNPIFNESFAFDIPTEKLRETTIIITVMDKDKLSRNDVIGKVGAWWVGQHT